MMSDRKKPLTFSILSTSAPYGTIADPITFTVSLTSAAYRIAERFRKQKSISEEAQQVYLNTLAVYAVNFYLQCLEIETDLEASDSWDPLMQMLVDVADLEVKNLGKLECRPILPGEQFVYIPPEVWEDRIGFVAVEINQSDREATLLGFAPPIDATDPPEHLPISDFQSLKVLIDYLQ